jgi:hypothetical protein
LLNDASGLVNKDPAMLKKLNEELFQGGKPAEPWADGDEPENVKEATMADVCIALIQLVLDPVLFECESEEHQKVCQKLWNALD